MKACKIIFFIICFFSLGVFSRVEAQESIIKRYELALDNSISSLEAKYTFPTNIRTFILPVKTDDINELYYYFAVRSGFSDFPFHYVIDTKGQIFQTSKFGDEQLIDLNGVSDNLNIGILAFQDKSLGLLSFDSLGRLLINLENQFSLYPKAFIFNKIEFNLDNKGKMIDLKFSEPLSEDTEIFNQKIATAVETFSPKKFVYKVEIVNLDVPEIEL